MIVQEFFACEERTVWSAIRIKTWNDAIAAMTPAPEKASAASASLIIST
jgi:hypothetical protein